MGILTRDAILTADDLPRELVSVPEWGGEVYVRTMTGEERDGFEAEMVEVKGKNQSQNLKNLRARLAARTMCDEAGAGLFTPADAAALGKKSAAALDRVLAVAMRLNGLGEKDVEELVKNSDPELSGIAGSA